MRFRRRDSRHSAASAALLMLLTFAAYLPAFKAGFIWDDDDYVRLNPVLHRPGGLGQIWFTLDSTPQYYPVVFTTFWAELRLWGARPMGYHIVNIALHGFSAILLWRILIKLEVPGALLASAIFAVHPVHAESVVWITERKNVLSGLFYFASFLAYLRWLEHREDSPANVSHGRSAARSAWPGYALAFFLFICALLSKSVACTLPAAILLTLWWKWGRIQAREIVPLLPFFGLGLVSGLTTAWIERAHVGATGVEFDLSFAQRILIAGRAVWFYLGKLVWPHPLIFIYPRWDLNARLLWQWVPPVGAIGLIGALWALRSRLGRGPLAACLFFGGTLLPALGFVNVYPMRYSFVADHFQYHASVGPIALAAAILTTAALRWVPQIERWPKWTFVGVLVGLLTALTWNRARLFGDVEGLWRDTLRQNPSCWMAHANLAATLAERGDFQEALVHAQAKLEARPDLANSYSNYAQIFVAAGRREEAKRYFRQALSIERTHFRANLDYGSLLVDQGKYAEAVPFLETAVAAKPLFPPAHEKLALTYSLIGKHDLAIIHYKQALDVEPTAGQLLWGLARADERAGRLNDAIATLREAIRLNPNFAKAYSDLGSLLGRAGQTEEAIGMIRQALRLRPDDLIARFNLACLLDDRGESTEAIVHFREVLEKKPDDPEVARRLHAAQAKSARSGSGR